LSAFHDSIFVEINFIKKIKVMKQIIFSICLLFACGISADAQTAQPKLIAFTLKNNSLLPAKLTVISYRPDETGNGTNGFLLWPYGTKTLKFPVGSKIYLASSGQVNTVMSGAKISDQPPFLTVKKEDADKVFKIN
jgi:hypothetical protein